MSSALPPPPRPIRKPVPHYPDLSTPNRAHASSPTTLHAASFSSSPNDTPPGTPRVDGMPMGGRPIILSGSSVEEEGLEDSAGYRAGEKPMPPLPSSHSSSPTHGMTKSQKAFRGKGSPAPIITPRSSSVGIPRNASPSASIHPSHIMQRSSSAEPGTSNLPPLFYKPTPPVPLPLASNPIVPNSKIHYLRAARGLSPPTTPPTPTYATDAYATGSNYVEGVDPTPIASGPALPAETQVKGVGLRDSVGGAAEAPPNVSTAEINHNVELGTVAYPDPADQEDVDPLKGVVGIKAAPDFTIDTPPTKMRLWEASQCYITDERGKKRRFGDFWDDLSSKRSLVRTPSSRAPSIQSQPGSRPLTPAKSPLSKETPSAGANAANSRLSMHSITGTGRLSIDSGYMASPNSEYLPSLTAPRSPSLHTVDLGTSPSMQDVLADVPATVYPSLTPVAPLSRTTTHMTDKTISTGTPSEKERKAKMKADLKKIGGEEWIVMGRKTVVFWIRHFWCGQCQDYTFASLSLLDPAAIHAAGINVIVISNGSWKIIKKYRELFQCPYPIYVDGSRKLYQLMGMTLENNDFGPLFNGRAAYHQNAVPMQFLHGANAGLFKMPIRYPGKFTQLGGEYIIGPGLRCDFVHRMTNTSNHLEAPDVLKMAGVATPTIPDQVAFQVAQEEVEALSRMHEEMEAWRDGRETEIMRIKRDKAERRGLVYEPSVGARGSVATDFGIQEGDEAEGDEDEEDDDDDGTEKGEGDGGEVLDGEHEAVVEAEQTTYLEEIQEAEDRREKEKVTQATQVESETQTPEQLKRNSHYTVGTEGGREETASLTTNGDSSVVTEDAVEGDDAGSFGPKTVGAGRHSGLFYGDEGEKH